MKHCQNHPQYEGTGKAPPADLCLYCWALWALNHQDTGFYGCWSEDSGEMRFCIFTKPPLTAAAAEPARDAADVVGRP